MSKLGPKCQYFAWPPLFSSTALTLLGMEFTTAFTLRFFTKAGVFVCSRYHVGKLPCGPVSEGRGSYSTSVCHSTCRHLWCSPPVPDHDTPTTMLDCRQDALVFVLLTSESSLSWGAVLNFQWILWESVWAITPNLAQPFPIHTWNLKH